MPGQSTPRTKPAEPAPEARPPSIAARLAAVRAAVSHVEKNGQHGQGYSFAQWQDVVNTVRGHLDEQGLYLHLSVVKAEDLAPYNGGRVVRATVAYEWQTVDTDEVKGGTWIGDGWDKGDKAIYKAKTGAMKYLYLQTFALPTGDDPEAGNQAEFHEPEPARPQVPAIPRDRAAAIVAAAKSAGLSETVFMAKVHEAGAERVVDLTVDQAEDVEAFIREAKA